MSGYLMGLQLVLICRRPSLLERMRTGDMRGPMEDVASCTSGVRERNKEGILLSRMDMQVPQPGRC